MRGGESRLSSFPRGLPEGKESKTEAENPEKKNTDEGCGRPLRKERGRIPSSWDKITPIL